MRLPLIPLVTAILLLGGGVYLFRSLDDGPRVLDAPRMSPFLDIDGVETEVAASPDGRFLAVIASGDLWLRAIEPAGTRRLTESLDIETAPAWSSDSKDVRFTRGTDTWTCSAGSGECSAFLPGASWWTAAPTGATAFIRERSAWIIPGNGQPERKVLEADSSPGVHYRSLRFSPDGTKLAYIRSAMELHGEIWLLDLTDGTTRLLVGDRNAEVPNDLAWILDGQSIIFLTNRSGGLSLWTVNLASDEVWPLTAPLLPFDIERLGISANADRVYVPKHVIDTSLEWTDGRKILDTPDPELEPALSPDGTLVAFTTVKNAQTQVWTANPDGSSPMFRALGRQPRFSANGLHLVYSHTDLSGNEDLWRLDLRGREQPERLTDAEEIDILPDASPDGSAIAFSSARGGELAIWSMPASGGKRLRLNRNGYAPRYSPDSKEIGYWSQGAVWRMRADGTRPVMVGPAERPAVVTWTAKGPVYAVGRSIRSGEITWFEARTAILPGIDHRNGAWIVVPVEYVESSVVAVDLQFKAR